MRRSGVAFLLAGLGLEVIAIPLLVGAFVYVMPIPAAKAEFTAPGTEHDFVALFITGLCYVFELIAFVWLVRTRRTLPLSGGRVSVSSIG